MPSIHDVARRSEVSIGTVSRVINNRPNVRAATREAVLAAIADLDYRPNPLGRNLRRAKTNALAMLVPNLTNQSFVQMVSGAESAAIERGYTLILALSHDNPELESRHIARIIDLRVDGLICIPVESETEVRRKVGGANLPVTVIGGRGRPPAGAGSPQSYEAAFSEAFSEFREFGHQRIALITTAQPFAAAASRISSLREELTHAGLAFEPDLARIVRTEPEASGVLKELLRRRDPPTALICGTLGAAPHALGALHELELRVPEDFSFVTLGDSEWAEAYQPGLNVLTVDTSVVAGNATVRLIRLIEGDAGAEGRFEPTWRYIRRGSVAPAKAV